MNTSNTDVQDCINEREEEENNGEIWRGTAGLFFVEKVDGN